MQKNDLNIGEKKLCQGDPTPETSQFVGGFAPHTPDAFGINPPSQLVIAYHWLAFLNQVLKQSKHRVV